MPNYCSNTLVLQHDEPAMITRAMKAFENGTLCNEFVPVPVELTETMAGSYSDPSEQKALLERTQQNVKRYGYGNWYDFCIGEWGTKWDVGDNGSAVQTNEGMATFSFESAWSPPIGLYEKLEELGFSVTAMYYEPGVGFAGVYDECGDDCYDLTDMDSQSVREMLPTGLDAEFGISDNMEEWERENQDEVTTWYKDGVEETGLEPHVVDQKLV